MPNKRQTKEVVSYKMSRVKSKGTEIEKVMGNALWSVGISGYRKNVNNVLGSPDFCWKKRKIAVFCDSSFWHGYKWKTEKLRIKVRKKFWCNKIETNIKRDKAQTTQLRKNGWIVLRFWDFMITRSPRACAMKVARLLYTTKC
jgi:DNA mismatch endonuclease Vsr